MEGIKVRLNRKYDRAAGDVLFTLRKSRGMTATAMAKSMGVSAHYVRARELGDSEVTIAFLLHYATTLDINVTTIIRRIQHAYDTRK